MTFSGVMSRNTSPTTSLPSAVTSLNATGTTLGAPLAQVASVCPICQEALSDEESAEAPPAAEEARRFRGSVLTAGRGSGWEPADTTVSAEEHAKKITTQMGGDLCDYPQVLLFAPSHIARKGECEGETFAGFPTRVQSPARRRPILRSKIAAPKKTTTQRVVVFFGAGDEESAEVPPAAEEARRFRGSVPTAGRGSGWEPADTTVSAEEHAKKSPPKWVVIFGAGDEARTRYLDLGKVALYQMSYARKWRRCCGTLVPPVGVEPTTRGFSVRCSTN